MSNDGYTMTDRSDITSTTSNYSLVSGGVSLGQACAKPVNDTEDSWQVKSRGKTRINGSTAQSTAGPFSTSANQPYSYGHARTSSASTTSSANSYGKPPNKGRNAWAKAPVSQRRWYPCIVWKLDELI